MVRKVKALFVHDHRFSVAPNGDVYTSGKLPYGVWSRYLKFFDELVVVGRSTPLASLPHCGLDLSSGKNVSFTFLPDLAHPWRMLLDRPTVVKALAKQIQSVDAVIIRTSLLGRIAASIAEEQKKPWAVEVVGCAWDAYWNYGSLAGLFFAPIAFVLQRRVVKRAHFAIYVTQHFLQKRYPCTGTTAGVSNVEVASSFDDVLGRRLLKIQQPHTPFVFGIIGSLNSKYKGIQTALVALKKCQYLLPDFELRILGGGDPKYWVDLAAGHGLDKKVKFEGTLPAGDAVLRWLDGLDVYLQPSFQEGLPRSLVEAMSRGCPAIGSTAGGIPELLAPEALHKPGKDRELGQLIQKSVDVIWRTEQAARNFNTARLYSKDVLDRRRDEFWRSFADHVRTQRKMPAESFGR